jgi:hypothetical protein
VLGPRGWQKARANNRVEFTSALKSCGAIRKLSPALASALGVVYADPLRNRGMAFLDAVVGPKRGLRALVKLDSMRIGIVGCGGIGSVCAYLLAALGVKHFLLIDPDFVEQGNLSRQVLYTRQNVGKQKVKCPRRALEARFDGLQIGTLGESALSESALKRLGETDVVICAGDEPADLGMHLKERLPPTQPLWVCGYLLGVSVLRGSRGVLNRTAQSPAWISIEGGFAPSVGFQNFELAASCVTQILQHCCGGKSPAIALNDYRAHLG